MLLQTPTPAPAPPLAPDPGIAQIQDMSVPPWMTLPPQVTALIALAFIAGCTIVLWPLMRALARRLEGRAAPNPALQAELEQLRGRVAELDQLQHRVAELEERVDFAERLLAERREPDRLPRG